jgi:hypothetical protein
LLIDEGAWGKPKETWGSTKKHRETQGSIGKGWGKHNVIHKNGNFDGTKLYKCFFFFGVNCHFNIHVYA